MGRKPPTPKGVRLTERQAQRIEQAAESGGELFVSTADFDGDAARRQTVQALAAKGIVKLAGAIDHGYTHLYELTPFGWRVYQQHRLIIRRMPVKVVAGDG